MGDGSQGKGDLALRELLAPRGGSDMDLAHRRVLALWRGFVPRSWGMALRGGPVWDLAHGGSWPSWEATCQSSLAGPVCNVCFTGVLPSLPFYPTNCCYLTYSHGLGTLTELLYTFHWYSRESVFGWRWLVWRLSKML